MAAHLIALSDALSDWLDLGLRWLHVIAAMAWIGTSFYFVLLDQSLRPPKEQEDRDAGVGGELWEVHGGGFYQVQKYVVAPPRLVDEVVQAVLDERVVVGDDLHERHVGAGALG